MNTCIVWLGKILSESNLGNAAHNIASRFLLPECRTEDMRKRPKPSRHNMKIAFNNDIIHTRPVHAINTAIGLWRLL